MQVEEVDDSLAHAMQMPSCPAERTSRGTKLHWEKNYETAAMCFERAGDIIWEKRAKAASLRVTADRLHSSNPKEACRILKEAGEIFDSIGRAESAAECFCDVVEYERAGNIHVEKCGQVQDGLKKAGGCCTLEESINFFLCTKMSNDPEKENNNEGNNLILELKQLQGL